MVRRGSKLASNGLVLLLGLALTGCSKDDNSTRDSTPVKIAVTARGETVTPNGERVKVKRGQPIEFDVTADGSGELHLHSEPAQSFKYKAGSSTFRLTPIDIPGVVEVEEEDLGKVIVQLEVR